MRTIKWAALFACAFTLSAGTAEAATYLVAKTGSNSNSCAQAQSVLLPKLTVREGLKCLKPGDSLLIRTGVYREKLHWVETPIPSGTAGNVITVQAYPGEFPSIAAPNPSDPLYNLVHLYGQSYLVFKGLDFNADNAVNGTIALESTTDPPVFTHHVRFEGNTIRNAIFNGVGVFASDNEFVGNDIHTNGFSATYGAGGAWGYGAYITGGNNRFEGNDVHGNSRYGIHGYSQQGTLTGNIIRSNRVRDNCKEKGGAELIFGGANNLIVNNLIYQSNQDCHGIEIDYSGPSNITIAHNTIFNVPGYCVVTGLDSVPEQIVIRNNICWQTAAGGIRIANGTAVQSNNLTGINPQFVSASTGNLEPSLTSPARNAGAFLPAVPADFRGTARDSTPDIGAYEYRLGGSVVTLAAPSNLRIVH